MVNEIFLSTGGATIKYVAYSVHSCVQMIKYCIAFTRGHHRQGCSWQRRPLEWNAIFLSTGGPQSNML